MRAKSFATFTTLIEHKILKSCLRTENFVQNKLKKTGTVLNISVLEWLQRFGTGTVDDTVRQRETQRHQAPV